MKANHLYPANIIEIALTWDQANKIHEINRHLQSYDFEETLVLALDYLRDHVDETAFEHTLMDIGLKDCDRTPDRPISIFVRLSRRHLQMFWTIGRELKCKTIRDLSDLMIGWLANRATQHMLIDHFGRQTSELN